MFHVSDFVLAAYAKSWASWYSLANRSGIGYLQTPQLSENVDMSSRLGYRCRLPLRTGLTWSFRAWTLESKDRKGMERRVRCLNCFHSYNHEGGQKTLGVN